jgi:chaperone required for assembly of F1-ATPase
MTTPSPAKRFYKVAAAEPLDGGFTVALDGRRIKTPAGKPLIAPTHAAADAVAQEWNEQGERIRPTTMPVTRAINVAIDRVTPERAAVAEIVAEYGATDMLCYRAPWPGPLAARQTQHWDPVLTWMETRYRAPLLRVEGVMHIAQPAPSLAALRAAVDGFDAFALTALHELVSIAGSPGPDAWTLSRIDEDFQIEQWGEDDEAKALAARRHRDFLVAERLLTLLRG